jgi:predicted nucleic acid-binding Zn ribbon protein
MIDEEVSETQAVKKVEKIPQHTHCQMCGKAVTIDKILCSVGCEEKYNAMIKRKKIYIYVLYSMVVVFVLLMVLSPVMK